MKLMILIGPGTKFSIKKCTAVFASAPPAGQTFWVTNPNEFENSSDPTTRQTVAAYVNEAVGTFFLCFTIALAADGHSVLAPLAIGR
jgi:glycerol uptake facilitator-like aquaporin